MTKAELEEKYVGRTVMVSIYDELHPIEDAIGVVVKVDDKCQIHGNWGGLAVIPGKDKIKIIGDYKINSII